MAHQTPPPSRRQRSLESARVPASRSASTSRASAVLAATGRITFVSSSRKLEAATFRSSRISASAAMPRDRPMEAAPGRILPRARWTFLAEIARREFNERLRTLRMPVGAWKLGVTKVERMLGLELIIVRQRLRCRRRNRPTRGHCKLRCPAAGGAVVVRGMAAVSSLRAGSTRGRRFCCRAVPAKPGRWEFPQPSRRAHCRYSI